MRTAIAIQLLEKELLDVKSHKDFCRRFSKKIRNSAPYAFKTDKEVKKKRLEYLSSIKKADRRITEIKKEIRFLKNCDPEFC